MESLAIVLKGFFDPLFIVFVLLCLSFVIFFKSCRQKSDSLPLLLCIVLLYGASIFPVANYLCYYLEKEYINNFSAQAEKIDAIVVFGNGTKDIDILKKTFNTANGNLRLVHAVEIYNKTGAKYFVCSGRGLGKISEAETMAGLAERLGVPKEVIRIEPNSKNTGENAGELRKIFHDKEIRIGLVTSAYHMKRSEREVKKYFSNVLPLPAHYLYASSTGNVIERYIPRSEELYKSSIAIREIVSQWWYKLK
jgi:uncharacterized SAM-binding protein YcdF (DUF218 family)